MNLAFRPEVEKVKPVVRIFLCEVFKPRGVLRHHGGKSLFALATWKHERVGQRLAYAMIVAVRFEKTEGQIHRAAQRCCEQDGPLLAQGHANALSNSRAARLPERKAP